MFSSFIARPEPQLTSPIRVIQVMAHLSRKSGGVFEAVAGLAPALHARPGVEVGVYGLDHPALDRDRLSERDVPARAFAVSGPAAFGYAPELGRALRASPPDLMHVHGLWMYPSVAGMSWSGRRMPYVVTPHGMLDPWALAHRRWKKQLAGLAFERRHLRGAACLHALCASERVAIRAAGLVNPVCVIPNGVDLAREDGGSEPPPWRRQVPEQARILLFLGRLAPQKGIPDLLRGLVSARAEVSSGASQREWHLVIAGWGEDGYRDELQRLVGELELGDAVHFVGPQFGDAKARSFAVAEAFVLPSVSEGLPIAVLEAWAARLPVVMTSRCNLEPGFEHGAALRIEPEPGNIAVGLRQLFALSDDERRAIGARGAELVAQRFSWSGAARDMEAVYRWVLGRGERPDTVDLS
ncbi:glycosyltransferase [Kaistia sp. MMO-174]|uniref:glycosyltransferase n=1 Tax=Kaistia sp. MMO-174 TaxID=3081256 RepID=UPI003019AAC4